MARAILDRSDVVRALAGVFRTRGFEGGSLSVIQHETGIGRGSLYHFFPEGKRDMAAAVLTQVGDWFDERVFEPLRAAPDASEAVTRMAREVTEYFTSRDRVCLFAAMTIGDEHEAFADAVHAYFSDWVDALAGALRRGGMAQDRAQTLSVDTVAAIQGGLVLARALRDDGPFVGVVERAEQRLLDALR